MALNNSVRVFNFVRNRLQYQVVCRHGTFELDKGGLEKIGNRDFVCYGINGQPTYIDRIDFPMPAVRFKENTPDVMVLREKEKGDWKKLSVEEKKALYRVSFCQTFVERYAKTGDYKLVIGLFLILTSCVMWIFMGLSTFVYNPLPETFSPENKRSMMQRMIDERAEPITGITSNYDYEAMKWKN